MKGYGLPVVRRLGIKNTRMRKITDKQAKELAPCKSAPGLDADWRG